MIEAKLFEIRDHATFIPALATPIASFDGDKWLIMRGGWFNSTEDIILTHLQTCKSCAYPYEWGDTRTMKEAHTYICRNWNKLVSGQMIDVRVILGETSVPVASERDA